MIMERSLTKGVIQRFVADIFDRIFQYAHSLGCMKNQLHRAGEENNSMCNSHHREAVYTSAGQHTRMSPVGFCDALYILAMSPWHHV